MSESPDGLPLSFSLEQVSWYWFTKSYGQSLWAYRSLWAALLRDRSQGLPTALTITKKPLGYSYYPGEILSMASSWVKHWFPNNLVFFKAHEKVRQCPSPLSADVEWVCANVYDYSYRVDTSPRSKLQRRSCRIWRILLRR